MLSYAATLKVFFFFHSWSCFNQLKFDLQQLHEGQFRKVLSACANLFCTAVLENKFWQHSPFKGEFYHNQLPQCNFQQPRKMPNLLTKILHSESQTMFFSFYIS